MSNQFDAFEQAMRDAEQRVINAGLSGGDVHKQVDSGTVIMASMSWAVRRIEASNVRLAKELTGNGSTVKDRIKKGGPAAGAGAAVVAILAYLRDIL